MNVRGESKNGVTVALYIIMMNLNGGPLLGAMSGECELFQHLE